MNDWDNWLSEQKPVEVYPLRIRQMWAWHGKVDNKCGKCAHLLREGRRNVYLKCGKTKITSSAATDWRAGWPACGLFEPGEGERVYGKR